MGYKNILDMHVHTVNSFDGNHSAMRMCEAASKNGMRSITFTDHCEVDIYERDNFSVSMQHAFVEVAKAKSAFTGKLLVNNGIELGQPTYDTQTAEKIIARFDYDQVIGSIHNLRGMLDFWFLDYSQYDVDALLKEYFDELVTLAQWAKFDTFAHITYPLRYIVGEHEIPVDMTKYYGQIETVLKTLAEKGKALEINTSGLRQKLGKTMPDEDIVKRFRELGGEYITVGSDAHYAEHVGAGIDKGLDIAKRCGFKDITLFQRREPVQIPIE